VASSPELIHTLERLLDNSTVRIRARAAVVLMYLGESDRASSFLAQILKDEDEAKRLVALEAYHNIALHAQTAIPFNTDLIHNALNDPVSAVRRQALSVAAFFNDTRLIESVAKHLEDEDAGVRRTSSESLKQVGPESRGVLLRILHESEGVAASYALDAIPVGDVEVLNPLRSYIQREVSGIRYLRMLIDSLPSKGRMVKLLVDTLKHRISLIEERLVKAVGLFGN